MGVQFRKKTEKLPRKQFFRDGCSGKHVEKDDSAKCGLIDSKGRKQKTIVINESGHVDKDEKGVNKSFTPPFTL